VGTTGLAAIDFLVADRYHVRPAEERWYTEHVLRMPHGYVCYEPPHDAPEVAAPPALTSGRFTFGCFNNPAKFSVPIIRTWSEILRCVEGSELLLKFGGLDDPGVQERFWRIFAAEGIGPKRVRLEGWSPPCQLLEAYNRVDIARDTQPYSGGVTTCEALWMGVPVITICGPTFAGRHAASHLSNAGYPQFVAEDAAGYVKLALEWSRRIDELAIIRSQGRTWMRTSPLCDVARFAGDFLCLLQEASRGRAGG
jgi:predicted O-linked N-acetylglucosamine transferase (SPINDLY family)